MAFDFGFDFDRFATAFAGAFFLAPALEGAALVEAALRGPAFFLVELAFGRELPRLKPGTLALTACTADFAVRIVPDETSDFPLAARFPIIVPAIAPTAAPTGPPSTLPTTAPAIPPAVCFETGNCDSEGCDSLL